MTALPEIEQVLEQLREALLRWHEADTKGEITVVRGSHEFVVEERPRHKHKAVKRVEGHCKG